MKIYKMKNIYFEQLFIFGIYKTFKMTRLSKIDLQIEFFF